MEKKKMSRGDRKSRKYVLIVFIILYSLLYSISPSLGIGVSPSVIDLNEIYQGDSAVFYLTISSNRIGHVLLIAKQSEELQSVEGIEGIRSTEKNIVSIEPNDFIITPGERKRIKIMIKRPVVMGKKSIEGIYAYLMTNQYLDQYTNQYTDKYYTDKYTSPNEKTSTGIVEGVYVPIKYKISNNITMKCDIKNINIRICEGSLYVKGIIDNKGSISINPWIRVVIYENKTNIGEFNRVEVYRKEVYTGITYPGEIRSFTKEINDIEIKRNLFSNKAYNVRIETECNNEEMIKVVPSEYCKRSLGIKDIKAKIGRNLKGEIELEIISDESAIVKPIIRIKDKEGNTIKIIEGKDVYTFGPTKIKEYIDLSDLNEESKKKIREEISEEIIVEADLLVKNNIGSYTKIEEIKTILNKEKDVYRRETLSTNIINIILSITIVIIAILIGILLKNMKKNNKH